MAQELHFLTTDPAAMWELIEAVGMSSVDGEGNRQNHPSISHIHFQQDVVTPPVVDENGNTVQAAEVEDWFVDIRFNEITEDVATALRAYMDANLTPTVKTRHPTAKSRDGKSDRTYPGVTMPSGQVWWMALPDENSVLQSDPPKVRQHLYL